jgi:hypothetical protein
MATWNDIEAWESAIESAGYAILSPYISNVELPGESDLFISPAVEVSMTRGRPTGHQQLVYNNSGSVTRIFNDSYEGTLDVTIVTDRAINDVSHSLYTGIARNLIGNKHNFNSGSLMPYHFVQVIEEQGTSYALDGPNNLDLTKLSFNVVMSAKSEVIPND